MIPKPEFDWFAIMPELITGVGSMLVLLFGMGRAGWSRITTIVLTLLTLGAALAFTFAEFHTARYNAFGGLVDSDELANTGRIIAYATAVIATVLAVRGRADDGRHGEFHALLLASVCGMGLLAASGSFVSLFIGLELFSISLYVLCALDADRSASLEAGL
jgi:NADH-quinone oxidoreductase subunit N